MAIQADVADERQVVEMFERAADELDGPIDLLVNNAGVEKPSRLVDMPLEEWNKVLAVKQPRQLQRLEVRSLQDRLLRQSVAHTACSIGGRRPR